MRVWAAIFVALLVCGAFGQSNRTANASKPQAKASIWQETRAQRDARLKWWREARLGMFIHWGLYSIPAGEWNGRTGYGEWIREEAHIPVGEYEKFRDRFNPVKFNADAWVKMAHDAGMKYVVITSKHHDGFNLFDSPLTDWNVGHTPFKRDIMAEMAKACKKYGLKMCWYHSIMDWHHPDYLPRRSWEVAQRPVDDADFRRFVKYLRDEVTWLLTHYGPIGVMWFDGEWESTWNAKDGDALYELCRTLQPGVIVNNRVTVGRGGIEDATSRQAGDFTTPEQYIPATGLPGVDWETCMTMNAHWGYNSHDTEWKSSRQLIRNIVDIASKGGNYLLNIGPRSDGTFPPEAVQRLHDIGEWMRVNGDSIYGTSASVFQSLPWGRSTTLRRRGSTSLFLQVFDWPKDGRLVVPGIGNEVKHARSMSNKRALRTTRQGSDLVIAVGAKPYDVDCSVVELEVRGAPVIYLAPTISTPSSVLVDSTTASIHSGSPELVAHYTLDGSDPTGNSPEYKAPIRIGKTLTLKAANFHKGKRVSTVASMSFAKVTPKRSLVVGPSGPGLLCTEYKGDWDKVPDFTGLTGRDTFIAQAINLKLKDGVQDSKEESWGRQYRGFIQVPSDGVYQFALTSDDGSKLWIDGEVIVDNDGLHSAETKTGLTALAKGPHQIVIGWFNKTGGLDLSLLWARVGMKLKPVGPNEIIHETSVR